MRTPQCLILSNTDQSVLYASPESSDHEASEDENDDDGDTESEAASETSHSNGHDVPAEELGTARPTSPPKSSMEKLDLNIVPTDYVNGHETKEMSEKYGEDSDSNSEEDDEDEDEPVLKYERLRGDAQELLEKDNASALAVSLRLMVSCS